jgi:transmembrane sensor
MNNQSNNQNNNHPIDRDLLKNYSTEEQKEILRVWEESGADLEKYRQKLRQRIKPVDEALSEVHSRLGFPSTEPGLIPDSGKNPTSVSGLKWVLAAAVILVVLGAGYLLTPRIYIVSHGEMAEIELNDGSAIEMNSGTRIRHNRFFGRSNRTLHLEGEAYFTIRSGDKPFIINANGSTVEVTGTRLNIRSWSSDPGSETSVTVTEGEVYFYPEKSPDKRVVLSPGKMSSWNNNMIEPADPVSVSADRILGWRNNLLHFDDKPLAVILNELERRFDVRIDLEAQEMRYETLTTYYTEQRNLETVLNDISLVKGLRYAKTANGYRIYR